jgi:hypothetical protein
VGRRRKHDVDTNATRLHLVDGVEEGGYHATRVRPADAADVNKDCEVNIADINALIDLILAGRTNTGDVNGDGEVNIADVNAVINKILGN